MALSPHALQFTPVGSTYSRTAYNNHGPFEYNGSLFCFGWQEGSDLITAYKSTDGLVGEDWEIKDGSNPVTALYLQFAPCSGDVKFDEDHTVYVMFGQNVSPPPLKVITFDLAAETWGVVSSDGPTNLNTASSDVTKQVKIQAYLGSTPGDVYFLYMSGVSALPGGKTTRAVVFSGGVWGSSVLLGTYIPISSAFDQVTNTLYAVVYEAATSKVLCFPFSSGAFGASVEMASSVSTARFAGPGSFLTSGEIVVPMLLPDGGTLDLTMVRGTIAGGFTLDLVANSTDFETWQFPRFAVDASDVERAFCMANLYQTTAPFTYIDRRLTKFLKTGSSWGAAVAIWSANDDPCAPPVEDRDHNDNFFSVGVYDGYVFGFVMTQIEVTSGQAVAYYSQEDYSPDDPPVNTHKPKGSFPRKWTPNPFDACLARDFRDFQLLDFDKMVCSSRKPACFNVDERLWQEDPSALQ